MIEQSKSLKSERSLEPLHISAVHFFLTLRTAPLGTVLSLRIIRGSRRGAQAMYKPVYVWAGVGAPSVGAAGARAAVKNARGGDAQSHLPAVLRMGFLPCCLTHGFRATTKP